jgi:hypothetical protein
MNLNKYDSKGFPYTAEEAAVRAYAMFNIRYVVTGYLADPIKRMGQITPRPYNVGRNAKKRAAKAARANLLRGIRHV